MPLLDGKGVPKGKAVPPGERLGNEGAKGVVPPDVPPLRERKGAVAEERMQAAVFAEINIRIIAPCVDPGDLFLRIRSFTVKLRLLPVAFF